MNRNTIKPPRIAARILEYIIQKDIRYGAMGDLEEQFFLMEQENGLLRARLLYWKQILGALPYFIKNAILWSFVMFKNYFKTTFRNTTRHKGYSFINLAGLAIGLACTLLILLWVKDELSYDRFHENGKNIYRIMSYGTRYMIEGFDGTPAPLAPAIKAEAPGIVNYARFSDVPKLVVRYGDKVFYENRGLIADPSIFEIFTFPFVQGDPQTAFTQPLDVVITETMAAKYFGEENPVGKTLEVEGRPAAVNGVIKDIPHNSHIQFDFLTSYEFIQKVSGYGTSWGAFNFVTYLQLEENRDIQEIAKNITAVADKNNCPQVKDGVEFRLQPLSEIYLDSRAAHRNYIKVGDRKYVYVFSIIAFFVLFIACVNFMNLSTARSATRAKEVGMRKTVGASRRQLIMQFFGESLFLTSMASVFALILVSILLPAFNQLTGKSLKLDLIDIQMVLGLVVIVFLTALTAGSYPALYLSAFKPVKVLKGVFKSEGKGQTFRRILVVTQFSLSIALLIGTSVAYNQLRFLRNAKLGFNKENIVYVPIKENIGKRYDAFKAELLNDSNIHSVAAQYYLFAEDGPFRSTDYDWEGREEGQEQDIILNLVDYDFIPMLDLELVAGRNFSSEYATDATEAYILNEEAIKEMGLEDPIGKYFSYGKRKGTIIGVLKDAHFRSLHVEIEPHVFFYLRNASSATQYGVVMIKINGQKTEEAFATIQGTWEKINPISPFEFHFLDQMYDNLYRKEKKIGTILNAFTLFAIVISCLGLFGLASFLTEQRTNEIGIRKVLGASETGIAFLLSKQFTKWVIIANLFAWPAAYIVMNQWLRSFAYRINMGIWLFVFSGLLAVGIALATVSFQAFKTARANPIDSLRYE
ncbi:MAG: ABC transporter permease [Candidatus Aminicenantes bacterium]|nr:MAG: ABC transporter permease [Candidatus Aminicenantes bacterium]